MLFRSGEYDGSAPQLYDLGRDAGETENLAAREPDTVARLTAAVLAWNKGMPPDNGATWPVGPRRPGAAKAK